jgi:peptide/nickel transport system substrate-binding protein
LITCVVLVISACNAATPTAAPTAAPTTAVTTAPTTAATTGPTTAATTAPATEAPTAVPTEAATEAPTAVPTEAGEATVLTAAIDNLGTMDWAPHLASNENEWTMQLLGETLVTTDPATGGLVGQVLESFELSDDLMTWTMKLRPNIPFHDGWGTVTSEDVKYTWGEFIRPDSTQSQLEALSQAVGGDMNNFEIVDDLTFKLHTTTPSVQLPAVLWATMPITSKKYHDEKGAEADKHPISTGPWKFVSSTPGLEIVLDAVKDHWRSPPHFDRLILKEIPDTAARQLQVQSGAVDFALTEDALVGEAEAAGLKIFEIPQTGNLYLIPGGQFPGTDNNDPESPWIQEANPEKGKAVREAMSLAIDRDAILNSILKGRGIVAKGPLMWFDTPALTDPSWTNPVFDPELAKTKLAEGGFPDGFKLKIPLFDQKVGTADIGEAIAGMFEDIGLEVERVPTTEDAFGPFIDGRNTKGYAWIHDRGFYPDPAQSIFTAYPDKEDAKFLDPVITQLYDDLSSEADLDKRYEIARQMIQHLLDETRVIPLFVHGTPYVAGPRVGGWTPIPGLDQINSLDTITPP